jgi:hypothetical protein
MEVEPHLTVLREKHRSLEAEIQQESQRPNPDSMTIASLKRQKLKIKDEIARLSSSG